MKATVEGVVLIPIGRVGEDLHAHYRRWGSAWPLTEGPRRLSLLLTLSVLDDSWVVRFHNSNARVGGSEIDTDDATTRDWIRDSRYLTRSFSGQTG